MVLIRRPLLFTIIIINNNKAEAVYHAALLYYNTTITLSRNYHILPVSSGILKMLTWKRYRLIKYYDDLLIWDSCLVCSLKAVLHKESMHGEE